MLVVGLVCTFIHSFRSIFVNLSPVDHRRACHQPGRRPRSYSVCLRFTLSILNRLTDCQQSRIRSEAIVPDSSPALTESTLVLETSRPSRLLWVSSSDARQWPLIPCFVALEPGALGRFLGLLLGIVYAAFAICGMEIVTLLVIEVC
jgi:hypothetical protein